MTHALDVNDATSRFGTSQAVDAPTATRPVAATRASKLGTFAITFGIALQFCTRCSNG
jgi:hypothetical protein